MEYDFFSDGKGNVFIRNMCPFNYGIVWIDLGKIKFIESENL